MAEQEGGRWDVGINDNAVYLARVSDSDERLLQDQLAPEEARHLAELLNKYAGKADESAAHDGDDAADSEDEDSDDDGEDNDGEDDDGEDDDGEDNDGRDSSD